jgi:hypothetical protein
LKFKIKANIVIKKSMLIWLSIIPLAFLNGALREFFIEPLTGIKYANLISSIILCILIFIVTLVFIPRLGRGTSKTYFSIGVLWLVSTVLFETILGLLMGMTFAEIIIAYNIATGNFWLIVVIFIGVVPFLVAKIKRII